MNRGYFYLILAAVSYASMGGLVRILSSDLAPLAQLFLRLIFSGFLTLVLVLSSKSSFRLKKPIDYLLILPMGIVGYGLELSFYTLSFYHTTISNALFIFSSYPIITAFFAFLFLKETITKRLLLALIILFLALTLIFNPTDIMHGLVGNVYSLLNAICFSIYVIFSRILSRNGNKPATITLWTVTLAILTSGIGMLTFEHTPIHITLTTLLILVIFGSLNFLGFNLINKGFASVRAGIGTLLLSLEAVFGSIIGLVFFHEIPTPIFLVGAIQTVIAIYIASFTLD